MVRKLQCILICFGLLLFVHKGYGQERTIKGKVTSAEDGTTIPGVNVVVKGTTTGTVTDINGDYTLSAPSSGAVLVFSFVGFRTQEVAASDLATVDVRLVSDVTQLGEVVVTGYGQVERRNVVSAITNVTSDRIKDLPATSLDQALQGNAPGVMVTSSSGQPGGGVMIRIRGSNSINASNRPLFIVDGVPVANGSISQRQFGGQDDNILANLNPQDIESYEVLKDAAAKAIYGSRASNGVVLITTKKGKNNQRTRISADIQRGVSQPTNKLELLNSTQLLELQREAVTNAGGNPNDAGIPGVTDAVNTDWLDEIFRQAIFENYQLSASGGTDKTTFYVSGAYRDEEGVQLNNRFQRYTGTLNLDHKATDKITFGTNLTVSRTENDRVKNDNFLDGVYSGALKSLPYLQPYDERGRLYSPTNGGPLYGGFPNFNPVAQALLPRFKVYTTKAIAGFYGQYEPVKNLIIRSKFNVDWNYVKEDQFESTQTAIGGFLFDAGYGLDFTTELSTYVNSTTISYVTKFGDKHNVSALLGSEVLQTVRRENFIEGQDYPNDNLNYINSAGLKSDGGSFLLKYGLTSFFGELKYNYAEKYYLGFTARRDGSSRFGEGNRYGFFPSVSAGYRISEEAFMKDITFVTDLKIRASWGKTGNDRFNDFEFLGTWQAAAFSYAGSPAVLPLNIANPFLKWEESTEFNVGFDVSVWNGRVSLAADFYSNKTNDLLLSERLPRTTGFNDLTNNVGSLSNKGFEFGLTTVNIDKALKWTTNFNISQNRNKVETLSTDEPQLAGYQTNVVGATHIITVGQPLGSFYGLNYLGVDPATGDAIYEDRDGNEIINADDATVIGNSQPDFFGGITNTINYKGFDVNVFFQYSLGNEIINYTNDGLINTGSNLVDNQSVAALRRWQKPGDVTDIPRYVSGSSANNAFSSFYVEDASYVRLKNLTIGYTLPTKWLSNKGVRSVRLFATGSNILTFTRYSGADPEVNSRDGSTTEAGLDYWTFPQVKTYLIGINIGL